jgi:hypothetical protein
MGGYTQGAPASTSSIMVHVVDSLSLAFARDGVPSVFRNALVDPEHP